MTRRTNFELAVVFTGLAAVGTFAYFKWQEGVRANAIFEQNQAMLRDVEVYIDVSRTRLKQNAERIERIEADKKKLEALKQPQAASGLREIP